MLFFQTVHLCWKFHSLWARLTKNEKTIAILGEQTVLQTVITFPSHSNTLQTCHFKWVLAVPSGPAPHCLCLAVPGSSVWGCLSYSRADTGMYRRGLGKTPAASPFPSAPGPVPPAGRCSSAAQSQTAPASASPAAALLSRSGTERNSLTQICPRQLHHGSH